MLRILPIVALLPALGPAAAAQSTLYGSEVQLDQLGTVDRASGTWTFIGSQGPVGSITGLAYDGNHDVLYGCSPSNNSLYTLDPGTGLATLVGPTGFSNINGLAYDPATDTLYCTDLNNNVLFTVDVATGAGTLIGTISGAGAIEGLGFDPATDTLYGLDDISDRVYRLDTTTAVATPLPNPVGRSGLWRGLSWDSEQGVLWATTVNPGELHRVDPATGVGSFIGSPLSFVQGLAFRDGSDPFVLTIPGPCPGPATASVSGASPNGPVGFLYALGRGSFVIPAAFTCAGATTGLSPNGIALAGTVTADPFGNASLAASLPPFACGRVSVQAVDGTTCKTSNVVDL